MKKSGSKFVEYFRYNPDNEASAAELRLVSTAPYERVMGCKRKESDGTWMCIYVFSS